jgi:hypothetical protein
MANITRIQNNQITDSTINASSKMVPGSITGNLLATSVTFNSNITILGNLTVANSYTQLNSINTYINDPVVVFNNNYTGSLTNYDIGILVNRNLASLSNYGSVNTFLGWSESAQAFIAIATTETGTNVSAINNSGYANVSVGNLTALGASVTNNLTAGTITGSPISGSTGYFTTAYATNWSTANAIVTNSSVTTLQATNFSSANAQITGGNISGDFNVSGTTGQFTNFSTANALVTSQAVTTGVTTNFSTGNAQITGGSLSGIVNFNGTTGTLTNFASGNAVITGGSVNNTPIGASTASTGKFTTLTSSSTIIASGNIVAASGTDSTSVTTGALVIAGTGGLGVGGNINVGQLTSLHNIRGNLLIGQGSVQDSADSALTINLNTDTPLVSNATVHMSGATGKNATYGADSFGASGVLSQYVGRHARGTSSAPSAVQALDAIAGFHGRGYGATGYNTNPASINPGITIFAAENHTDSAQGTGINFAYIPLGATSAITGLKIDPVNGGNVVIPATNGSGSPTSGALVVNGGIGVGGPSVFGANLTVTGNAIIQGNLTVNGAFEYINTTITTHIDPILELSTGVNGTALTVDNLADVGLRMHYFDGTADRGAFIGRTHDTGFLEYYAIGTESGNTISGTYGTIKGGAVLVANSTAATSTTSGALQVAGGAGVVGALYVGGLINAGTASFASINNTPIGNATPSTGAFTTLTAITSSPTNLNATFGNITTLYAQNFSSGNIQVTGGYLSGITNFNGTTGTLTNFASGNAVITGGSVNGSPIGASSASTGAFTTLTTSGTAIASGNIVAGSGTASTNTTTGALVVVGGAGVSGNATIGGDTVITGDAYVQGGDIWTSATTFNLVNATATTVNFAGAATTLNTGNASGTTNMAGVVKASGNIVAASGTASTNTTTGALVVVGGAGVSGAVNIGGNATIANATTFNSAQAAGMDTVIKGVNDATLFWARPNATYDSIIIGNSATAGTAVRGAKLNINTTDSIILPTGTNAQRPGSTGGTDTQGMFRYNTTVQGVEWYTGTQWVAATTSFTVIADSQFTGTGSQTAFTLPTAQTTASCIVSINGVVQIPTLAYSVSTTTLTFTEAPASTDIIDVRMLTTTATVTQISSTNGYMQFLVDNNGAYVYTGSVGTSATTYWDTAGAEVNSRANVTTSTTGNTTIDSFSSTVYSSAEYLITSTISGTNIRELTKILVVTDGTNAYRTVYGVTGTAGNTLTTWSANVSGGTVTLWGASTNANTIYRVKKDYQAI